MTVQTVPLQRAPAQALTVELGPLSVALTLRTLDGALYADVTCNGAAICAGRRCLDRVPLTDRAAALGFPALHLAFADLQGTDDPRWQDFGTRFVLLNMPLDTA